MDPPLQESAPENRDADHNDSIRNNRASNISIGTEKHTIDLLLTEDWCSHWDTKDAIRELVQNFLDGICTTFRVYLRDLFFTYQTSGDWDLGNRVDTWIAYNSTASIEYGWIRYKQERTKLIIVNHGVTLSENDLCYGISDKGDRPDLIGGFGEGMKIGILRLLSSGCPVTYKTGSELWKFVMRQGRNSMSPTLHCISRNSAERTNLQVVVTNIPRDQLEVTNFLPLSIDVQGPVMGSVCDEGWLIAAPLFPFLALRRIYVKGVLVDPKSELRVSVNFLTAYLNRDRRLRMVPRNIKIALAKIWGTVFQHEKDLPERPYTAKFLTLVKDDTHCLEFQSIRYMSDKAAECLYSHILSEEPKAFPYKQGSEKEAMLISSSLKLEPYPVHKHLLRLLRKLPGVCSVYEAQEKGFLSDYKICPPSVHDLQVTRMITAYVSSILKPRNIRVEFIESARSEIDVLFKDGVLFCNFSSLQVEGDEGETTAAKLDLILSVAQELQKGVRQSEIRDLYLKAMQLAVSAEFQGYLYHVTPTETGSSFTNEEAEEGQESRFRSVIRSGQTVQIAGVKRRTLEGNESVDGNEKGSKFSPDDQTGGPKRPRVITRKERLNSQRQSRGNDMKGGNETEISGDNALAETRHHEIESGGHNSPPGGHLENDCQDQDTAEE